MLFNPLSHLRVSVCSVSLVCCLFHYFSSIVYQSPLSSFLFFITPSFSSLPSHRPFPTLWLPIFSSSTSISSLVFAYIVLLKFILLIFRILPFPSVLCFLPYLPPSFAFLPFFSNMLVSSFLLYLHIVPSSL